MNTTFRYIRRWIKVLQGKDFFEKIDCHLSKEEYGSGYGSWVLSSDLINNNSIVYSFGIGEDISFDLAIMGKFGLKVNAFDPTPKSIKWIKSLHLSSDFRLHEYGLADFNGESTFFPPENPKNISHSIIEKAKTKDKAFKVKMRRLETIMQELNHSQIDVLKMDIEGAEYCVIEDIQHTNIRPTQILVEFHHRFPNIGIRKSKLAINKLREMGYNLFSISKNGEEFSFILKNKTPH